MSWNQVEGYWMQALGRLREHWGVIRHRPLDIINGQRTQVVGRLQRTYGASEISEESAAPLLTPRPKRF
ncbi:MAG: CsbD family protein [Gemmatimonas sp.]